MAHYVPSEGDTLTVELPHEMIRATVVGVLDDNTVLADLNQAQPFTRLHGYNYGERLRFRRQSNVLGEKWAVVDKPIMPPPAGPVGPPPRVAAEDEHPPLPQRPVPRQKAKRRSDATASDKVHGKHSGNS